MCMYKRLNDSYFKYSEGTSNASQDSFAALWIKKKTTKQNQTQKCEWLDRAKSAKTTMINAQTVPYRRPNKEAKEESKCAGWLPAFSCFLSVLLHPSPRQCPSSERNLEQIQYGVHPPLPIDDIAFLICASSETLLNIVQNHFKMPFFEPEYALTLEGVKCFRPRRVVNSGQPWICFPFFLSRHFASECPLWMCLFSQVSYQFLLLNMVAFF